MSVESLLLFVAVTVSMSATPGPVMMSALLQGAHFGIRKAQWGMLGATAGHIVLMVMASLGIGWLAQLDNRIFTAAQLLGASYLFYLGARLYFVRLRAKTTQHIKKGDKQLSVFCQSFTIACSNPKGIIYFATLLPPFIDTQKSIIFQLCLLTFIFIVIDYILMILYALAGKKIVQKFQNDQFVFVFNRVTGGAFIAIALTLIWDSWATDIFG